jgi:hypothetical protein
LGTDEIKTAKLCLMVVAFVVITFSGSDAGEWKSPWTQREMAYNVIKHVLKPSLRSGWLSCHSHYGLLSPLTIMLAFFVMIADYPFGVVLAIGRGSKRVCDKFMGKRSLSPHPHPALPLKGENSERLRPKEHKSIGILPLQWGGRGMGLWEQ